jgi:predicted transcriptional regulator
MTQRKPALPTSVRLDEFQLRGLDDLRQLQDRSRSWLVGRAVDLMLEHELGLSRQRHEHQRRLAEGEELLRQFQPKPFRLEDLPDPGQSHV